ncbi:MAG: hypothetical protein EBU26_06085 [Verrucomicrobia bacterium]|jgi:hypothetical protein|nr:hypothetical protein [Verrucomicrobiota bacterium]
MMHLSAADGRIMTKALSSRPSHIMLDVYCPECRTRRGMVQQQEEIILKDRKILKGRCASCQTSLTKILPSRSRLQSAARLC